MDSNDDSNGSEEVGAQVIDIRDRLPPHIFGDNPTGKLAVKIFKLILDEGGPTPHVWFAALMVTSFAFQRLLKNIFHVQHEKLVVIFSKAQEEAESMDVNIQPKTPLKGL
jgi:hypothetical protein